MSKPSTETLFVVVEREISYPLEKIWRALTQPQLIEEWLMKNDLKPVVDTVSIFAQTWGRCPAGSAAGLPGRQVRVAAVLCKPGAAIGADRLKSAGTFTASRRNSADFDLIFYCAAAELLG
jgi:hypothetical protein